MRPRAKPLQAPVYLPHHPHWAQVSLRRRASDRKPRRRLIGGVVACSQVRVRSWLRWRRLRRRLQRLRGPPLSERGSLHRRAERVLLRLSPGIQVERPPPSPPRARTHTHAGPPGLIGGPPVSAAVSCARSRRRRCLCASSPTARTTPRAWRGGGGPSASVRRSSEGRAVRNWSA